MSPVRHLKDGFIENTQSKSHLLTAVHSILKDNIHYFPSYEIVIDELRDYRFFKEDLVHPNELAVKYIWERIQQSWIDTESIEFINDAGQYKRLLEHRVLNKIERSKHEENVGAAKKKLFEKFPKLTTKL